MRRLTMLLGVTTLSAGVLASCDRESTITSPADQTQARDAIMATTGAVFTMTNAADGNEIIQFARGADGSLVEVDRVSTGGLGTGGGLGNQGGVVRSQSGNDLFTVNAGSNQVAALHHGGGLLTLVDVADTGNDNPISVTTSGDLVYVVNTGTDAVAGSITGFRYDGSQLTPIAGSTRMLSGVGSAPAQIEFSPAGDALVVTEKATNQILVFPVASDGVAGDAVINASEGMTPFGFTFTRKGRLLVSEAFGGMEGLSAASSYELLGTSLVPISSSVPSGESAACWLIGSVNERYAYVTNTRSGSVSSYTIEPDGGLSLLDAQASVIDGSRPLDAVFSRNGRYLFVLRNGSHEIGAYRVNADGGLAELTAISVPEGVNGLAAF